jgi:hypothetical protein
MATNRAANRSAEHSSTATRQQLELVGTVSLDPEYINQIITYTTCNIWKERCRRIYDNKAMTETQLTALIRQEVAAFWQAT